MTYICEKCGYNQNFEPTLENMLAIFPNKIKKEIGGKIRLVHIEANQCPSCYAENSLKYN